MRSSNYLERRDRLTVYFDQTAAAAWQALTSNDPVNRIRATVRAGRDAMRQNLLDWLPEDFGGRTLLDAGCGTGTLAIDCAKRNAKVIAVDVAPSLVDVAQRRANEAGVAANIDFRVGDMLADAPAKADFVVAMDSLIHYHAGDVRRVVTDFAGRARETVLFTVAPWTPALGLMHMVGRMVPNQHNRAPAIEPLKVHKLKAKLDTTLQESGWQVGRQRRIKSGFYISEAMELQLK